MSAIKGKKHHGYHGTPAYRSWNHMKKRCGNPKDPSYKDYGGRGITYDPKWETFEGFFEDMGPRPEGTTLDRYPDKNGNYCKSNCRWATKTEQSHNRRSNVEMVGVNWCRNSKMIQGGFWRAHTNQIAGKKRIILYQGPSREIAIEAREFYNSFILGE